MEPTTQLFGSATKSGGILCGSQQKVSVETRISDASGRGFASEELRRHNLTAVLDRLHLGGPMSRSELAARTGLNRSTIRDLIGELANLGLVVENRGTPSSGPGRPSSVARVSPRGAVVLAVELEVDSIAVATVGLGGQILGEVREPNPPSNVSPDEVITRLGALSRELLEDLPPEHALVGAGVAVAGVVRRSDGFVHTAPNLGWHDVPIAAMVGRELGVSVVRVANEADLGALGEFRRGAGREARHMLFVAGEVGVGVGIIHEAAPMLGLSGYAGEAGHTMVNLEGRSCRCGAIGCWETEVGEEALLERAGMSDWTGVHPVDEILRRAGEGDQKIQAALWEEGRWLGIGIGNLINIFNPEMVVVGGFFHALYPSIGAAIEVGAKEVALDAPWESCTIRRSELGNEALLLGAAELVLGEVVSDPAAFVTAARN